VELIREIFGCVKVFRLRSREDSRGLLTYAYEEIEGFEVRESRIYRMPRKGTFFGIHYREERDPMTKFVSLIHGRGLNYVVDLRPGSETYLKWEAVELSGENGLAILVPAGIGNAFLSLEDGTEHLYMIDRSGNDGHSKQLNYLEEKIGLVLPVEVTEISDYDRNAPFLK